MSKRKNYDKIISMLNDKRFKPHLRALGISGSTNNKQVIAACAYLALHSERGQIWRGKYSWHMLFQLDRLREVAVTFHKHKEKVCPEKQK